MFTVLLVDDEHWILSGLQQVIDWKAEGFHICGVATNGLEAEDRIADLRPDLVLADIRMPIQDGLTLLRHIRARGLNTLFMFLSGYADFRYAQEAIHLGACGYILKPVEEVELIQNLRHIREQLAEKRSQCLEDELESDSGYLQSLFPNGCFLSVVRGTQPRATFELSCSLTPGSRLYVTPSPLYDREEDVPPDTCVGWAPYSANTSLIVQVNACRAASWGSFVHPERRLFQSDEIPRSGTISFLPVNDDPESNLAMLRAFRANLSEINVGDLYLAYLILQGYDGELLTQPVERMLNRFGTASNMLDELELWLQEAQNDAEDVSIRAYLEEHYRDDLSLYDISRLFSMSVSSVRRTLIRETGDTFQHYLTALRMEQARKLLVENEQSINDITYNCGFHDALYFRKVFKKWYGLTPSQYRWKTQSADASE